MKNLIFIILAILPLELIANECRSELVRMDIDNRTLETQLTSKSTESLILKSVEDFFKSPSFNSMFITDYPIFSFGFPYNSLECTKEKERGVPRFRNVNCDDVYLCSSKNVSEEMKSDLCYDIPCSFIKGRNMSECNSGASARPIFLHFPEPVKLKKIEMKPVSAQFSKNQLRGCFLVKSLEVSVGVDIEFANTDEVSYERLGLKNIDLVLDGEREVCLSATVSLAAERPLTQLSLENMSGQFVSDSMINRSLSGSTPHGLTGYNPETINTLKISVLPTMARYFRKSIEEAIKASLVSTFELQITSVLKKSNGQENSLRLAANTAISELGVSNIAVKKYADLIEGALIKKKTGTVPTTHPSLNQLYPFKKDFLKISDIPRPESAARILATQFEQLDHITSASLKDKIMGWKTAYREMNLGPDYDRTLAPLLEKIERTQDESALLQDIELQTRIQQEGHNISVGLSFSKLCNKNKASSYVGKSMQNCPISTYVDLEEVNSLLQVMFQSGRLCHRGDGSSKGPNCHFIIEDFKGGMSCDLGAAPRITQDPTSKQYNLSLKTKNCFRGAVFAGQGKIAGDINFDISFDPGFCGSDFCLQNGVANWSVVPGTARFALKESSFLNGMVRKTVDTKINEIIKSTIRIPLASEKGPLAKLPFVPDGRSDKGSGYFGACLKYK